MSVQSRHSARIVSITRSAMVKPLPTMAPIAAKAGCLYPNNARALLQARADGFDNCVIFDGLGNVAELATANLFIAKDGTVKTPAANGAFLNGVTRLGLLRVIKAAGLKIGERPFSVAEAQNAAEALLTSSTNFILPVVKIDDAVIGDGTPGPLAKQLGALYVDYAAEGGSDHR